MPVFVLEFVETAYPRFATRLPIIHPLTNRNARYGWSLSSNVNDIITSKLAGIFKGNVATKNPTPAAPPGKPAERSRATQLLVSNPGRCHPARSPKSPPSFSTPRVVSGYLRENVGTIAQGTQTERMRTLCTRQFSLEPARYRTFRD
jgi:hypothetical protein